MNLKRSIDIFALSFAVCSLLLTLAVFILQKLDSKEEDISSLELFTFHVPQVADVKEVTPITAPPVQPKSKRIYTPYIDVIKERAALIEQLTERYKNEPVHSCSMQTKGIVHRVNLPPCDTCKTIFLTLDACISGFDSIFIKYLIYNNVKATLFVTARWINNNMQAMQQLCAHRNIFDIENHGTLHRPASVCGCTSYGIHGTENMAELVAEVEVGADIIERLTGVRSAFFRSGTAFADNVAVCAIGDMGYRFIGFSIAADDGATLSRNAVKQRILSAQHGDILLLHFNSKNSETHLGFMMALEELKQKKECVRFEKLSDFSDKLEAY